MTFGHQPNRPNPDVLEAAKDLVNMMMSNAEAQRWEEADFFTIECFDPESWEFTLHGKFETAPEALAYAEKWEAELNAGFPPSEAPFKCRVHPVTGVS